MDDAHDDEIKLSKLLLCFWATLYRSYACDVKISGRPRFRVNRITRKGSCQKCTSHIHMVVDRNRVQTNGIDLKHGSAMTYVSAYRVCCRIYLIL